MGTQREDRLAEAIAETLRELVPAEAGVTIDTKHDLRMAAVVDDRTGAGAPALDDDGLAIRRSGAYQQDLLVYEKLEDQAGAAREIPRVAIEVKAGPVTTHDVLLAADRSWRLRETYPYLRMIFLVALESGELPHRLLRVELAYDALMVVRPTPAWNGISSGDAHSLAAIVRDEIQASRATADALFQRRKATLFWRSLEVR